MKAVRPLFAVCLAIVALTSCRPAVAADDPIKFLQALQENGYADVAIEYLKSLKNQKDAPPEILSVWDYEMSRCLRAASRNAYTEAEAKRNLAEAEVYLQKFIKENPKRPEAIKAAAWWADNKGKEALIALRQAMTLTDKKEKSAALEKARKSFEEVRPLFAQAGEAIQEQLNKLPRSATARRRDELTGEEIENRLKVAVTDFYIAQACEGAEREANFAKAGKVFSAIRQSYGGTMLAVTAHYWQGRISQERGKFDDAQGTYEEVLVSDPNSGDSGAPNRRPRSGSDELAAFFAEVEQFYLQCLAKGPQKKYFEEVQEYRKTAKATAERTDGYQGLTMDLARYLLNAGAQEKDKTKKARLEDAAIKLLREMTRVPSGYQHEAIELVHKLRPSSSGEEGFEDAIVEGDNFSGKKDWPHAIESYTKALEAAPKTLKKEKLDAVKNAVAACWFNVAHEAFLKNDLAKAEETLTRIVKEYRETATAPTAATLLLTVQLNAAAAVSEDDAADKAKREQLMAKVTQTAKATIAAWPEKAEADAARLALLRIAITNNKLDDAKQMFREINPKCEHYGTAYYLISFTYWRQYKTEKREIEEKEQSGAKAPDDLKAKRDADRKAAVAGMERTKEVLKSLPHTDTRMSRMLVESQLLLAEMYIEGNDHAKAISELEPLVEDAKKNADKSLDETALRVFNNAITSYLQTEQVDKAADIGTTLIGKGPDDQRTNVSLMNFAKRMETEAKKLDATLTPDLTPADTEKIRTKRDQYNKLLEEFLKSLSAREKMSPQGMVWTAQTCANVGMTQVAEKLIEKIFDKRDNDQNFKQATDKAVARLRTLDVQIKTDNGKYSEALEQIDALIKEHPNALEPQLEKGRILQKWSDKEPENLSKAISCWERVRLRLDRVPAKNGQRVKEIYDVTYNEALCLYNLAKKSGEKERARTGMQLLKQMLLLDPKFKDPKQKDPVLKTRYESLINKLEVLQGIEPSKAAK